MLSVRAMVACLLGVATAVACDRPSAAEENTQPLIDYVQRQDDSYQWKKVREGKIGSTEVAELILTSQTWRNVAWKHRLVVLKPSNVDAECKQAVLVIGGGRWKPEYEDPDGDIKPPREGAMIAGIAEQLQAPLALLLQVPHQPMFDGLVEDEIISLTFDEYLKSEDPTWPLLLPMVKSAVRGMDAVQEYCRESWDLNVETFTVTGGSKRGWTTWLTGVADKRAAALAPMVIDTLNMGPQMLHQLESWGEFSEQIQDYTRRKIQQRMNTAAGRALRRIVDPYAYREMLRQPKLILIGTNDRYWPLDALNLYWDGLVGPKYILYVPNNGHGLKDFPRIVGGLKALHQQANGGPAMPKLRWSFDKAEQGLRLSVNSEPPPRKVDVWLARSDSRDFRQARWSSRPAQRNGEGYEYALDFPDSGFVAMFGEAVYGDGPFPCHLSTNVRIVTANGPVTIEAGGGE